MKWQGSDFRTGATLVAVLSLGAPGPAAAQIETTRESSTGARWAVLDAIGYGGLGFGLGLLASWDRRESSGPGPPLGPDTWTVGPAEETLAFGITDLSGISVGPSGTQLAIVGATTVAGTLAGAVIGRRAQEAIEEGRPIGGAHRAAVLGGGVMAGGTVGAVAAAALIMPEGEGTFLGSDEQAVFVLVLAGSALGALYVWRHRHGLLSSRIRFAPETYGRGGYGLRGRITF